ncbi:MAG: hypothetical protein WD768_06765 [Phycisphaeraceae bacterium]
MKRSLTSRLVPATLSFSLILAAGSFLGVTALTGCDKKAGVEGQQGKKLTLTQPKAIVLTQGAMTEVKITITRDGVQEPIAISFDKLPAGVSIVDADKKIVGNEGLYVLKADEGAALVTEHHAQVTAKGPDGLAVSQSLVINIKEKTAS